jgi:hypothetical protein
VTVENVFDLVFRQIIETLGVDRLPFIWFWPDGLSGCCVMTHDVETAAGRDFCSEVMRMESNHGVTSAFGVVPEERYEVPTEYLEEIRARGHDIYIHGLTHDGHLFSSEEEFRSRAKKINRYAREFCAAGFRSPVMYRQMEWIDALELEYDMSMPNVGHLDPQRGGCCTVMPYFIGNLVEIPLTTTQDYSLFHILQDHSIGLWEKQISLILNKHGLINFIVHPDYITAPKPRAVYESLLAYLADLFPKERVWHASPRDVASWWRKRSQMKMLERNDGRWEIVGPDRHRARVAFARLEDDRMVYETT